jgi:hypothetical protein
VRIRLTAKQVQQLQPYIDRVRAAAVLGSPGMLVGQIGWNAEGQYMITPAFLDHDKAKVITEAGREESMG